ncbi:MAG: hypothetical protein HY730_05300 [Candidatus Tectomicrobia bacterium]|uniref:Uncharacterized protein n=1 Tax=Tectimicrobiota bacterium TaxID=2528274 RepID=A0A933GMC8_UNCTE|nr:hypothetical protein [Candidatus Tectomicrobia bacterium]
MTDSVNSVAGNLIDQVHNSAEVTTGVASGDLSKKITAESKGEILQLIETINTNEIEYQRVYQNMPIHYLSLLGGSLLTIIRNIFF